MPAARAANPASAIIEEGRMQADQAALAVGGGAGDRLGGELVALVCRQQALGDVAPTVVRLQEEAAMVAIAGGHAAMPEVGDEQGRVAGPGEQRDDTPALEVEIVIQQALRRRRTARELAARNDAGGAVLEPAILEKQVDADGEHRMGDVSGPTHAVGQGDVRAGVDVPRLAAVRAWMSGRIAPVSYTHLRAHETG